MGTGNLTLVTVGSEVVLLCVSQIPVAFILTAAFPFIPEVLCDRGTRWARISSALEVKFCLCVEKCMYF